MVLGNFQCRNGLQILTEVGQGPTVHSVGAGRGCLDVLFLFLSLSLSRNGLQILTEVGQGPTVHSVGAGRGCLDVLFLFFSLSLLSVSFLSSSLGRRLDIDCNTVSFKEPLIPKQPISEQVQEIYFEISVVCNTWSRILKMCSNHIGIWTQLFKTNDVVS